MSSQNVQYYEEPSIITQNCSQRPFPNVIESSTLQWQFRKFCFVGLPLYTKSMAVTQRRDGKENALEAEQKIMSTRVEKLKVLQGASTGKVAKQISVFSLDHPPSHPLYKCKILLLLHLTLQSLLFLSFLPSKPVQISFMPQFTLHLKIILQCLSFPVKLDVKYYSN